jgi:hypothetical protein
MIHRLRWPCARSAGFLVRSVSRDFGVRVFSIDPTQLKVSADRQDEQGQRILSQMLHGRQASHQGMSGREALAPFLAPASGWPGTAGRSSPTDQRAVPKTPPLEHHTSATGWLARLFGALAATPWFGLDCDEFDVDYMLDPWAQLENDISTRQPDEPPEPPDGVQCSDVCVGHGPRSPTTDCAVV